MQFMGLLLSYRFDFVDLERVGLIQIMKVMIEFMCKQFKLHKLTSIVILVT